MSYIIRFPTFRVEFDGVEKQMVLGMRALPDFMLGGSGKVQRPPDVRRRTGASEP